MDLRHRIEAAGVLADQMASTGMDGFLRWWTVDSSPPARLSSVIRPFQIDRYNRIAPAIERVAGLRPSYDGPKAFWNICARGYDKSGSIARTIIWTIAYYRTPVSVIVAASDQDQANIIHQAAENEVKLNPWIAHRVKFKRNRIEGAGGVVDIIAADAPGSYGLRPDLIVCDELTWWETDELWHAVFTSRQKRPNCVLVIISNAGVLRTWQHELYTKAKVDPRWMVWETDPAKNPTWMSQKDIDEDAKLLPVAIAKRLYKNLWIDPSEDAGYLLSSEIEACQRPDLVPHYRQMPSCKYTLSIDYGPRKDRTVLSQLHMDSDGLFFIDECTVLQGSHESPVKIADVEEWLVRKLAIFPQATVIVDPYQLESTVQRFEGKCQIRRFEPRGTIGNYKMAELLRTSIMGQRLLYPVGIGAHPNDRNDTFVTELCGLIVKVLPGRKYRFDHEVNKHDDRACSVGMGLIALHEEYIPSSLLVPQPILPLPELEPNPLLRADRRVGLFGMNSATKRV